MRFDYQFLRCYPLSGLVAIAGTQMTPRVVALPMLLRLYLVIPVAAVVVMADLLLGNGQLRETLPSNPQDYLLLALLFGTPHIVASNLILFTSSDYRTHYRPQIIKISAAIALFFLAFGWWVPYEILFALVAGWTIAHVVKQQLGIGNIVARSNGWTYQLWGLTGIAAGVCYYNAIFLSLGSLESLLAAIAALLASVTAALTVVLWIRCESTEGKRWIVANGATMVGAALFFLAGYELLAILVPRFLHDVTAFAFYVAHEDNRAATGKQSTLVGQVSRMGVSAVIALPLIAIALSAVMERGADEVVNRALMSTIGRTIDTPVSIGVVGFLALLHYSFESFTWKSSSPYMSSVHIRPS